MLFNSHIFMLLFLPLLLAGWYFLNWKKKFQLAQGYLIGMSLWFYAYANLQYLWLLLFSCLIGWLLSCLPEKIFSEKGKKVLTGVGCVFHLGLLGYFKYSNFFLENLNTVFHTDFPMLQILMQTLSLVLLSTKTWAIKYKSQLLQLVLTPVLRVYQNLVKQLHVQQVHLHLQAVSLISLYS